MHATHSASAGRHPPNVAWRRILLAIAALLMAQSLSCACVQAQNRQRSAFPQACTHLLAQMRSTPNGPEDEFRFDTQRIQQALNLCPAGESVELEATGSSDQPENAFLIAPFHLPAGVTLLIDAGVTVFASRRPEDYRRAEAVPSGQFPCGDLPCRALIDAQGGVGPYSTSVSGFGTLDGRGSAPLFDLGTGNLSWDDFPPNQRPLLIQADGSFELHKLTVQDAPANALHLSGNATAIVEGAKFIAPTTSIQTRGIVVASSRVRLAVTDSTFSQRSSAIAGATPAQLSVSRISIHNGTAFSNQSNGSAPTRCVESTTLKSACTPAYLPLYVGEIFLSDQHATNLIASTPSKELSIHAVLTATEPGMPTPLGSITFYDGTEAIGKAPIVDGIATLKLPPLDPTRDHVLTASDALGNTSFASAHAMLQTDVTSLTLSASATHASYNTAVDLTASATPSTATGLVSFYDGTTLLDQAPLSAGIVTFSETQLTPGTHTLTAHYAGDSSATAADSPPLTVRIDRAQTSLSFSALPTTAVYGTLNRATVDVSPSSAAGTVTLTDALTANGQTMLNSLGSASLTGGTASFPLSNPGVGNHVLTATYSGDSNDLSSTAATGLTVVALPTTLSLSTPQSTLAYGAAANFAATVAPASATGSITFHDSIAGSLGQASILDGAASLNVASLTPGTHSISATYSGDAINAASVSPSLILTVTRIPSTLALAPLPAILLAGSPLTLTAAVQPKSASGNITFSTTSGATLGHAQLIGGSATLTLNTLAPGSYLVVASYGGDSVIAPSTSSAEATQITAASSVALALSTTSGAYGSPIILSARVTPPSAVGLVTFSDVSLGTLAAVPLNNGSASIQLSNLATGSHTLIAIYSGDSAHPSATSPSATLTIAPAATVTSLTLAQSSVPAGSPVVVNVQVTTQTGDTPTGAVQIETGGHVLASGKIANSLPGVGYVTLTVPSSTFGVGSFPVSAVYDGDSNDAASSSSSTQIVNVLAMPTASTLTLSSAQVPLNSPVTLVAQLTSPNATDTPTGSVSFLEDGVVLTSVPVGATGFASTTFAAARLGSHAISAVYNPTGIFAVSSAAVQPLTVTLPVALTFAPNALNATANSTHPATLTITPLSGFAGPTQTACSSPASFITCTVNTPAAVSGSPVQATVQITIARDLSSHATLERPLTAHDTLALTSLLPFCFLFRKRFSRLNPNSDRLRIFGLILFAVVITTSLTGCALGGNFFTIPTGPQTVSVEVTAGGTTVTSTLTVNITQ